MSSVHIITIKHLKAAAAKYKDVANEIEAWIKITKAAIWHNFPEVRATFPDADQVDKFVIFDFRNNRYRLVTSIHYVRRIRNNKTLGNVYIRSFLTHKEYDNKSNWDRGYTK